MLLHQRNRAPAYGTLVDMSREFDRLMNSVWTEAGNGSSQWPMPAEIVETADEIRIDIEAPGFRGEDLEVTIENNVLTVAGEKKAERDNNVRDTDYRLAERSYGRFQRSFSVPSTVSSDRCEATYENGVLTLRLPKVEAAKPRRIQVGSGTAHRNLESGGDAHAG